MRVPRVQASPDSLPGVGCVCVGLCSFLGPGVCACVCVCVLSDSSVRGAAEWCGGACCVWVLGGPTALCSPPAPACGFSLPLPFVYGQPPAGWLLTKPALCSRLSVGSPPLLFFLFPPGRY